MRKVKRIVKIEKKEITNRASMKIYYFGDNTKSYFILNNGTLGGQYDATIFEYNHECNKSDKNQNYINELENKIYSIEQLMKVLGADTKVI